MREKTENEKTEEFLDCYRKLETSIRATFPEIGEGQSPVSWLTRHGGGRVRRIRSELDYCRETRNLLSHHEKLGSDYAVTPTDKMIETLQKTIELLQKDSRVRDIWIPAQKILSAQMSTPVRPVMRTMAEKSYTHVPILENGRVIGAFSENTLLSYIMRDEIVSIEDGDTFEIFADLLPLGNHASESFCFVAQNELSDELAAQFLKSIQDGERLGMAFVTANGSSKESLLGIVTAWDIAAIL